MLHPTYARPNVVHVKQGDEWIVDPSIIIDICVSYFKQLIGPQLVMTNEVTTARHEFYDVVGCSVHDLIRQELDADFTEDEVDTVLRHLPSGKSPGWDGLTNEVFKRYSNILKGLLTLMFQHYWDSGLMPQAWKVGPIKLVPKVAPPESFHQWRPISLMAGCIRYLQWSWQDAVSRVMLNG